LTVTLTVTVVTVAAVVSQVQADGRTVNAPKANADEKAGCVLMAWPR
jgi:hypothetical protein